MSLAIVPGWPLDGVARNQTRLKLRYFWPISGGPEVVWFYLAAYNMALIGPRLGRVP